MTVLVVDHGHSTRCGIRDLGIRIADKLSAVHVDCNSMRDQATAVDVHDPSVVIVNYRPDLMPWWRPSMRVPQFAILHNYGPDTVDARAADLLDRGFDQVLVLDPTVTPVDPRVHAVGRPLPPAPSQFAETPPDHPRIGSFGFAFPHKGFADVAAEAATIPDAVYALHMPEAHFNGGTTWTDSILVDIHARLDGRHLEHTADELTPQQLIDRLAGNHVNCLLYTPGQPDAGLSSALDYLIAAGRPMLVSSATMFAAAQGHAAIWPDTRLTDMELKYWEGETGFLQMDMIPEFEHEMNAVLAAL
jgi:hypothetical protein